jgi:hypothetical protein
MADMPIVFSTRVSARAGCWAGSCSSSRRGRCSSPAVSGAADGSARPGRLRVAGGQHLLPGVLIGSGLGTLIPHYLIGRIRRKRVGPFIALFPEAIGLMVRGAALRPANQFVEHEVW